MIKSSKHILKFQNKNKNDILNQIFVDYKSCLIHYIDLILTNQLPLQNFCSSKLLPTYSNIEKSHWKESCYIQASGIIRSNLKYTQNKAFKRYQKVYRYFYKRNRQTKFLSKRFKDLHINILKRININIKTISIDLKYQNFDIIQTTGHFNNFIRIVTPYKVGKRYQTIKVPFKDHRHSNKFKDWKLLSSVRLEQHNNNKIFLCKLYEKEDTTIKEQGKSIGFDSGYKKLLSDSNGVHYGTHLNNIYNKLSKMKRGSKKYTQYLYFKKTEINRVINQINLDEYNQVVIEDLVQVKHKSKLSKKVMNKMQYWSYKQVIDKLEDRSRQEGFLLTKVNPAYTSQTCSSCGTVDKSSRKGEIYLCPTCGILLDADHNAAINILHKGT